jgi:hypothetical protein
MTQFYTYLHCKPNGDPFYVGKGCDSVNTKRSHRFSCRNQHHKNIVAKYGRKNIGVFIFPCDSEEQAFADERQQISQLRHDGYELCNKTNGGEGPSGLTPSDETRTKLSLANKGKIAWNKGIPNTKEQKDKISAALTGKKRSPEVIARIANSQKGRPGGKSMLGKKHSSKSIEKMSVAKKGKKLSEEHKMKISIANKGRTLSSEQKEKISQRMMGNRRMVGKHHSKETREKISRRARERTNHATRKN